MGENVPILSVVTQVALVVRDVEATSRAWADVLGVTPPVPRETAPQNRTHARYRGEPTQGRAKLAFFDLGTVKLEIIEPIGGPSTWQDHLDRHGEGVHHVAFEVRGMDGKLAALSARGMETVQRGDFAGGWYAYVDAERKLKVVLELLEETADPPHDAAARPVT
ncbi:MAG: VOC family protein [Planctomycetota bacterium]